MVIIGIAVLLPFGMTVIVSISSAWIPIRRVNRLPIKNVVLDVAEEAQVSSRFIVGVGIVLFLVSEILPKIVTGNMLYTAGGFSLSGLITATILIVVDPKISMLSELGFVTFLSAGVTGVLVILTGSVVPIVKSKKMKLVEETEFEQPEDLRARPTTGNIAVEREDIVKDFRIGETTTRVLKNAPLKVLKGEFVSIMGQSGSDDKKFKDYQKQLDNISEIVGLSGRRRHTLRELSGGQQQRAATTHALISDPEILFADEPMGSLDNKTGTEIMKLL